MNQRGRRGLLRKITQLGTPHLIVTSLRTLLSLVAPPEARHDDDPHPFRRPSSWSSCFLICSLRTAAFEPSNEPMFRKERSTAPTDTPSTSGRRTVPESDEEESSVMKRESRRGALKGSVTRKLLSCSGRMSSQEEAWTSRQRMCGLRGRCRDKRWMSGSVRVKVRNGTEGQMQSTRTR